MAREPLQGVWLQSVCSSKRLKKLAQLLHYIERVISQATKSHVCLPTYTDRLQLVKAGYSALNFDTVASHKSPKRLQAAVIQSPSPMLRVCQQS